MNSFISNTWSFWVLVGISVSLTLLIWVPVSADQQQDTVNQIDEISVDDELRKTIIIKLEDGISSSDEIH